jgi:hypothetical protein
MFISNNAKIAAIDVKTMSTGPYPIRRFWKMLVCDVDGSNCETLGPVIALSQWKRS